MMKNTHVLTKACFLIAFFVGLSGFAQTSHQGNQVLNDLKAFKDHSTFVNLLDASDLSQAIAAKAPVTIFAPSNQAFKQLSSQEMQDLKSSKTRLKKVVGYHILPGKWTPETIKNELTEKGGKMLVKTLKGQPMEFFVLNNQVYFFNLKGDKVQLPSSSLDKDHTVLYNISKVMTPPNRNN